LDAVPLFLNIHYKDLFCSFQFVVCHGALSTVSLCKTWWGFFIEFVNGETIPEVSLAPGICFFLQEVTLLVHPYV